MGSIPSRTPIRRTSFRRGIAIAGAGAIGYGLGVHVRRRRRRQEHIMPPARAADARPDVVSVEPAFVVAELERLTSLLHQGALSQPEFEAAKREVLDGY